MVFRVLRRNPPLSGQTQSNLVKPGQAWSKRKQGFDRKTQPHWQASENHQEMPQKSIDKLDILMIL